MPGWHYQCNGHNLGQSSGDGEGQEGLVCCNPWGLTGRLKNNNNTIFCINSSTLMILFLCPVHRYIYMCVCVCIHTATETLAIPCGSEGKASACNARDLGSIPGWRRSPGEGNDNPLQYSCLENPMDGEAWWATVHGVAKSWT